MWATVSVTVLNTVPHARHLLSMLMTVRMDSAPWPGSLDLVLCAASCLAVWKTAVQPSMLHRCLPSPPSESPSETSSSPGRQA